MLIALLLLQLGRNEVVIALTHIVSPNINQCELSFRNRQPIDVEKAVREHEEYCKLLRDHGLKVIELSVNKAYPDSTFIEDTAVVVDEIAVMANPGAESRRGEVEGIEPELAKYRKIAHIQSPATLDGGDVLQVGKKIFVGRSPRTNSAGIESLKNILMPLGYRVIPVKLKNCLHLKSACTSLDEKTLLANTDWLDLKPFADFKIIPIPKDEPWAANILRLNNSIILHVGFTKTIALIQQLRFNTETIDISELLKAEAGLTCSSIIFRE